VQAFFSLPTDLGTIGSVVVSAAPSADTLASLCADPNAPIDLHRSKRGGALIRT
jgi:hypothetical protein